MENKKIKNIDIISSEVDKCVGCKVCTKECIILKEYCNSPKDLMIEAKDNGIDNKIPFSCNLCDKCEGLCPKDINMGKVFWQMRKEISLSNNGKSPIIGHKSVHIHQDLGFSKAFTLKSERKDLKTVFLPGCSLSAYNPKLVINSYSYLQKMLPDVGIILQCCGKPTESMGEIDSFNEKYKILEKLIDDSGATEVITACQSCFKLIKEKSPKYKVKSLWSVIKDIGIPQYAKGKGKNSDIIFSIHDSCPTRFETEIQDSIRIIIDELGYKLEESKISREKTSCCGMGGMVMPADKNLFNKISKETANSLSQQFVVTYCASCREVMTMAGKKSVHILDLIFNSCYYKNSEFPGVNKVSVINWINRYKTKLMARKEMR